MPRQAEISIYKQKKGGPKKKNGATQIDTFNSSDLHAFSDLLGEDLKQFGISFGSSFPFKTIFHFRTWDRNAIGLRAKSFLTNRILISWQYSRTNLLILLTEVWRIYQCLKKFSLAQPKVLINLTQHSIKLIKILLS